MCIRSLLLALAICGILVGLVNTVTLGRTVKFAESFCGNFYAGDPERLPEGLFAKEALQYLGWWGRIAERIVSTGDARAALMFAERNVYDYGIIYATDARITARVETAGMFPRASHAPIVYPAATLAGERTKCFRLHD